MLHALFVIGDILDHAGLLGTIFWDICTEAVLLIFVLDPVKKARSLRLCSWAFLSKALYTLRLKTFLGRLRRFLFLTGWSTSSTFLFIDWVGLQKECSQKGSPRYLPRYSRFLRRGNLKMSPKTPNPQLISTLIQRKRGVVQDFLATTPCLGIRV